MFDYKLVCSLFVPWPDVPNSCCHPWKHKQQEGILCAALHFLSVLDPCQSVCFGNSILWSSGKVPQAPLLSSGTWSSLTLLAQGEEHSWDPGEHTAHRALCTAQNTGAAGAGSAVKAAVTFGTSLGAKASHCCVTVQQFQRSWLRGVGFRYRILLQPGLIPIIHLLYIFHESGRLQ